MSSGLGLFPGGFAGAGLLLLRAAVALQALMLSAAAHETPLAQLLAVILAISVCIGFQTRVLALLLMSVVLLLLLMRAYPIGPAAISALSSAALALSGPGALSVDARLFGRRTVRIPDDTIV